ncbi:MAG: hypothetical protein M3Q91_15305 [Acidobacteriota bacterium]|nr:hypothetical protein [Acidobacteriota bacterium]
MIHRIKAFISRLKRLLFVYDRLDSLSGLLERLDRRVEFAQEALGRIESRQLQESVSHSLIENEFRAFSQWGEDGIIQFLLRHIEIERKIFVEFGSDNYNLEANTRFLLSNNNWSGLIIDSSEDAIRQLQNSPTYMLYDLKAVSAFITRDNINDFLTENGIAGEIGILSIDVDGNDYWIWNAINVINPAIVIVEYNHRFGRDMAVTIPYEESFDRAKAHPSRLYFGASLKALCCLGDKKGYAFIGCNSNGVNAFFVRKYKKPEFLRALTAEEGYVPGKFGELIERNGELIKLSPFEEKKLLLGLGLPLIHIEDSGG